MRPPVTQSMCFKMIRAVHIYHLVEVSKIRKRVKHVHLLSATTCDEFLNSTLSPDKPHWCVGVKAFALSASNIVDAYALRSRNVKLENLLLSPAEAR